MEGKHINALIHFGTLFLYLKPKEKHTSQNLHPNYDNILNTVLLYSTKYLRVVIQIPCGMSCGEDINLKTGCNNDLDK